MQVDGEWATAYAEKASASSVYLTNVTMTDFRSYRHSQELRVDRNITVLAGRNNVGKTALLRGIRLPVEDVAGKGLGCALTYTWRLQPAELFAIAAHLTEVFRELGIAPQDHYSLQATFVQISSVPAPGGYAAPDPLFSSLILSELAIMGTSLRLALGRSPAGHTVLTWQGVNNPTAEGWTNSAAALVSLIHGYFANVYYIQPRRNGTQSQALGEVGELLPDGSNLTQVLATLYSNQRRSTFAVLREFMRAAFPEISEIEALIRGAPAVATIHIVYGSGAEELSVPLEYCGTGIEQMLMLATAILTAHGPRLFLIDEPHAFLHPAAERSLLRLMREHDEHQYIVATHSAVFLNALPLTQSRLLTIDGAGSHVNDVRDASEILSEIGVTAADLWTADALLWIEGPSDVRVVEEVIAHTPALRDLSIRVHAMPDWMRSLSATEKRAAATVGFCASVHEAVSPLKMPMRFLFDADEKQSEHKQAIERATGGSARFLPVRELENMLLVPEAVHAVLGRLCETVGTTAPTIEEVRSEIAALVEDMSNRVIYKTRVTKPDVAKVVGSAVLRELWSKWAKTEYDKVSCGPELVRSVLSYEPQKLEPLVAAINELAQEVHGQHPVS